MDAIGGPPPARGDLHVHSIFSTDSGNYALRRARLRESFEDDVVLHVLAWSLTEGDHQDLQPERGSVYALVELLRERSIAFALAHPLYRMGAPITPWHVERMMLLFDVWEGRNGARPSDANILACRLAEAATPSYLAKLTERHGIEARHDSIALTGGSDDHGGLDIATTWTEAQGESVTALLETVCAGRGAIGGEHGSTEKLAHAVAGLFLNAYRRTGRPYPEALAAVGSLFDTDTVEAGEIHEQISTTTGALTRSLFRRAREGLDLDQVASLGPRLATLLFAGALHVPHLATARHHSRSHLDLHAIESAFFGVPQARSEISAIAFTDTFDDTNGVAGTMRRLALEAGRGALPLTVVTVRDVASRGPGLVALAHEWSLALPAYTDLELHFPDVSEVRRLVESSRPDVVHVSTPGPVGVVGLAVAKLLGILVVGAYHTELGPYALELTKDLVVAEPTASYVTGSTGSATSFWRLLLRLPRGSQSKACATTPIATASSGRLVLAGHSMGGALAVLAALERPGRIESLALISPAGLPLTKPIAASAAAFFGQMLTRRYPTAVCIRSIGNILAAPRSAFRVAQRVRALDLTQQMLRLRESGIAVRVIGCSTDTLVTASHSKRAARLLGAGYRELDVEGGHTWMFGRWARFRSELSVHA